MHLKELLKLQTQSKFGITDSKHYFWVITQRYGFLLRDYKKNIYARRFGKAAICPKAIYQLVKLRVVNTAARYSRSEILVYLHGIACLLHKLLFLMFLHYDFFPETLESVIVFAWYCVYSA